MNNYNDLRYDVLRILQVFAFVAAILSAVSNFINNGSVAIVLQPIVAGLFIVFIWFYQKRNQKHQYLSKLIFLIFFNVFYLPITWYTSPGVSSSIGYYAILIIVVSVFFVERVAEFALPIFSVIVSILMIRFELLNPEHFQPFADKTTQINDITFNFTSVAVILFLIITYINRYYVNERAALYQLSITDELTGLNNRRYIIEYLETLARHSDENEDFTLLFMDVNNFKEINDTYGHHAGDQVLIKLGHIIKENFKISGRFGGDEFLAIIFSADEENAQKQVDNLKDQFQLYCDEKSYTNLSLSIGMTSSKGKNTEEIIKVADTYMYKIKHGPRKM
jgi:diguanylate cyclase (GGDEF)-like protein